jgi:outer membrane protein OmpA-like peptidoglycan-associated protein
MQSTRRRSHGALWSIIYIDLMTQIMAFDQTVRMVDLPGDVLFSSGQTSLAPDGRAAIDKLFGDADSGVLSFDQGGLASRKLVIHGHTDDVGDKDKNLLLGYQRAFAVYQEIKRYSNEVPDHVVLCTHADNTPAMSIAPNAATDAKTAARSKNRRITIEDLVVATKPPEAGAAH